jgi:hypothetical protein
MCKTAQTGNSFAAILHVEGQTGRLAGYRSVRGGVPVFVVWCRVVAWAVRGLQETASIRGGRIMAGFEVGDARRPHMSRRDYLRIGKALRIADPLR